MAIKSVNLALHGPTGDPETPVCPDHKIEMRLRGMMGRPARFSRQTESTYTRIYFCPIEGCNQNAERKVSKSQAPVPGESPDRPVYARHRGQIGDQ